MKRRRITFVLAGGGLSGGNRIIVGHANRLLERGHDVSIVVFRWPLIWRPRALYWRIRDRIGYVTRLRHEHLHDFRGRVIWQRLARLEEGVPEGDAVVATHWMTADPVAALPASKGQKYYFLQHHEAHVFDPEKVNATWRLPLRKIVIARWLEELAIQKFGDAEVAFVPNGVDTNLFHASPRELRRPPCVGVMYSGETWKCTPLAFEAIRRARETIPDLRAVCFGDRPIQPDMPLPANTRFFFRPPQETIREIYAGTDVWLCASRTEGFALPPLEAMACRCPVVCTRCGGPEDFVTDGENGYLVPVDDAGAMADGIVRVLADAKRWQRMSDAAYATRLRFTWEESSRRMEAALTDWSAATRAAEASADDWASRRTDGRRAGSERLDVTSQATGRSATT